MILKRLRLVSFRSYDKLDISFDPGITAAVGENAAGKTNLVEGIQMLSLARSFRTSDDAALIKSGAQTAVVEAEIQEGAICKTVRIEVEKGAKRVFLNGKPARRFSELSEAVNVISFSPPDAALFASSPQDRRNFLDISLSKQSPDYMALLGKYNALLRERNALLKQEKPDLSLLGVLTEQLLQAAAPLVQYRSLYISRLNEELPKLLAALRGKPAQVELVYRPFVKADASFLDRARKAFEAAKESDLFHKVTSLGIQREDFQLKLEGKDISEYGSQGENRLAVLALKLAPYFLIGDGERKPICVLDDVTSELDASRVQNLFALLRKMQQVFVTTTQLSIDGVSYVDVTPNRAIRRN